LTYYLRVEDDRPTVPDEGRSIDDLIAEKRNELIGVDAGGFVIDGEIGRGGMGVVYSATHPMIGKRAAIKVLKRSLSQNPATVERFLQEARSVNAIGHPNIVDIFAFGRLPDGRHYLVMDLLEGEPLRKRVKRGALPVSEAALVIDEIATALQAAHAKGFIHRDLKPDNVFLVANPNRFELKLLDFGLAKLSADALNARAYRTATGAQIGTPDYMSPEQLRSSKVDARTDIYALGVMAFELLVGGRPRRTIDGSIDLQGRRARDVLAAVPGVPAELAELVETMMSMEPDKRASLAAVRAVIKRVRPSLGIEAQSPPPGTSELPLSAQAADSFSETKLDAHPMLPSPMAAEPVPSRAGLRTSGPHASTKLGHAPAPVRPRSAKAQVAPARKESRLWLVIAVLLLAVAAGALVFVLAS